MTVDMRQEEGRQIIKQLANKVDVLVENFRPGVMEKWKLGPKVKAQNQAWPCIFISAALDAEVGCLHVLHACILAACMCKQYNTKPPCSLVCHCCMQQTVTDITHDA